jgi:two-component system, NtrC family, response regulator AtoC
MKNGKPRRVANHVNRDAPPLWVEPAGSVRNQDDGQFDRIEQEFALWSSPKMQEVRDIITQAARTDVTVLITGETGAGKDLVARSIHHLGARRDGPFVKVNCAAVARELLESELFGHERGAFTGAHQLKIGKFEAANDGTIFLDEIGDLDPALQGKLLHVLEDGHMSRVGGRSSIKVNVRVVAATNQQLERAVLAAQFRQDLYYRLNVVRIAVPPLRERPEEIPLLIDHFIQRYMKIFQREQFSLSPEVRERLLKYRFPGNVRELENVIKRMIVLNNPRVDMGLLLAERDNGDDKRAPKQAKATAGSLKDISRNAAQAAERAAILRTLEQTRWNRLRAAKLLNISYRSLLYKIKNCALNEEGRSPGQV